MTQTHSTKTFHIVVTGGDGIGPEVCDQSVRLIEALQSHFTGVRYDLDHREIGVGQYQKSGAALPDDAFAACQNADAILLGAMGLPNVRYPDGREIAPQLDLRERLNLYGGVRPIRLFHQDDSPLKKYDAGDIDFVLVRESTEGLFAGRGTPVDLSDDVVENVLRVSREGCRRVCDLAFRWARRRDGMKKVSLIDKANVLGTMVYFRHIFDEVAADYPDITAEHVYIDATALYLVQRPETFDVLVTENMFGDILSDLSAGLVGGMGMAPSGDIGDTAAVFQPSHGSAPDIAGRGIANPVAMHLSTAMMLRWLDDDQSRAAGEALDRAIAATLADRSHRTPDMGGSLGTAEMTDRVLECLSEDLS